VLNNRHHTPVLALL